jgi:Tol biopolymer transport system component
LLVTLAVALLAGAARAGVTERVSVSSSGEQGNNWSYGFSISADGRFVTFDSGASNLVPGDTNGAWDAFVRDRLTGTTERVSVSTAGVQGNGGSGMPSISADGRFVAFASGASNLVPGDTNGECDVFVRDRLTGKTELVSVSSAGEQGNDGSDEPSISADGGFVAFQSYASNLVPDDTSGYYHDIFVRDRLTGTTERVSVSSAGEQANWDSEWPCISADGRFVGFDSEASNLVPGDTNGHSDAFVRDRLTGQTERVSVSSAGEQGNATSGLASVSADERFVAFASVASNLVPGDTNAGTYPATGWDVFVRDRLIGTTERVSVSSAGQQVTGDSAWPSISADGRFVAFYSYASTLVPGDTNGQPDIFVRDRLTRTTELVSVSSAGEEGNSGSFFASISADGRLVAFDSWATNLVPGDTNGSPDVFVRDRWAESVPPETTITFGPCGLVISTNSATICWQGSDNSTPQVDLVYSWRLDSDAWQPFSFAACANLTGLSDGAHVSQVKAKDLAGNEDPTPAQCSFTVDLSGPSVSITAPAHGATVKGVVNLYATASHSSGIAKVEFYAAGQLLSTDATAPYSCAWDTRPTWVAEGLAQICAKAYANSGKVAWACVSVTVDNCTFDDVGKAYPLWRFVEGLVSAGVTSGCSSAPPLYCPDRTVTRGQTAELICKAAGKTWLEATTPTLADVPKSHAFYGWIERLADAASWGGRAPTSGCAMVGATRYFCPNNSVTRGQTAKLLCIARAKTWLDKPTPTFSDVPATHMFYGWIERLADAASWGGTAPTSGCTATTFCPNSAVTRAQTAKFLCVAFGMAY